MTEKKTERTMMIDVKKTSGKRGFHIWTGTEQGSLAYPTLSSTPCLPFGEEESRGFSLDVYIEVPTDGKTATQHGEVTPKS